LLAAFSDIFSENQEQKAFEKLKFGQKRSMVKAGAQEGMLVKEIVKKNPSMHQDNRKDNLRLSPH
jgi:hypothetical protein